MVKTGKTTDNLPGSFFLGQNYPNPFNPTTTIKYSVYEPGLVTIKVYDVLGNEITTLVDEDVPVGNYEVEFDGGNLSGGVYFYKMSTGKFTNTKKFVLMK